MTDWRTGIWVVGVTAAAAAGGAHGASYTWTVDSSGPTDWNSAAPWTQAPDTGFPNGIGAVANLTNDITVDNVIDLEQQVTVGVLNIGDAAVNSVTLAYDDFVIQKGAGVGSLIFDNGAATAKINVASGSNVIANDVDFTFAAGQAIEIDVAAGASVNFGTKSATVAGGTDIIKSGAGTAILGRSRTYTNTGDVIVRGGTLSQGRLASVGRLIVNTGAAYTATDFNLTFSSIHGDGQFRPDNRTTTGAVIGDRGAGVDQSVQRVVLTAGGSLHPGDDDGIADGVGSLQIGDNSSVMSGFRIESGSDIYLDIASAVSFDQILLSLGGGDGAGLIEGGDLHVNFLNGYVPVDGQTFKIIATTRADQASFADGNGGSIFDSITLNIPGSLTASFTDPGTNPAWVTFGDPQAVTLTYSVPEPGAAVACLIGLAGAVLSRPRRARVAGA